MDLNILKFNILFTIIISINSVVSDNNTIINNDTLDNVFNGVYTECFFHLSYLCLQKKTLLYLKELNNLSEVSVIGDYVKFVKINSTNNEERSEDTKTRDSEELAFMIDRAVDHFFDIHVLKFNALGRDITMPRNVEEFVGRKKRKGGGGGGHGGEDGGKKKMMMMAMMCMKMKLMMMVPAMMGMMGMMSFKGMMFSMMSFMLSKMMLLMKLLEKKGGGSGFGGGVGGGDGGWMAGGGGGGAWMPAGGQDFAGGGGGYDANGQWQSRSIIENEQTQNKPIISYVKPLVTYNNKIDTGIYKDPVLVYKKSNVIFDKEPLNIIDDSVMSSGRVKRDAKFEEQNNDEDDSKGSHTNDFFGYRKRTDDYVRNSNGQLLKREERDRDVINSNLDEESRARKKRSLIDLLQNSYLYWMNKILGLNNNRRTNFQRYKVINGVKYVYYPYPFRVQKQKSLQNPTEVQNTMKDVIVSDESFKPVISPDDFNKGEIMEGGVESRMNKKKFNKMKDTVNDTMEDNPWE